jgi:hypothetical protein
MSGTGAAYQPTQAEYVAMERDVLQDNIILVDAKSGILMAFCAVVVFRCFDKLQEIKTVVASTCPCGLTASAILYWLAVLGLLVTTIFAWKVVKPRITKTNDLIYWGADAFLHDLNHFTTAVQSIGQTTLGQDVLQHLFVLAAICRKKFESFNRAIVAAEVSVTLALAAEAFRYFSVH